MLQFEPIQAYCCYTLGPKEEDWALDGPDTHLKLSCILYHDHGAPKVHGKNPELSSTGMSSVVDTSNSDCKYQ
jgi:hypothetical protein